ncbi:MAG: transketolase [Clostridia bacterium]|nr:transketolase [Clostridia bacterium]
MLSNAESAMLAEKAKEIRKLSLRMFKEIGKGHVGGAMSIADLLSVLYFKELNINPADPKWADRDRVVLSKGHAGPALYAALALRGFFPEEMCLTLNQPGTLLPSHCDMKRTPGIDMTAGSLAQGFSASIGLALAGKLDAKDYYIYSIIGDGESQEGQIWEAAMLAGNRKLSNLIAFCDNNKMQIDGTTNDVNAISEAIAAAKACKDKPSMIILDTVKGKGLPFAEGLVSSHSMNVGADELEAGLAALN